MKLSTLISIANPTVPVAIYVTPKDENDTGKRFNFTTKSWDTTELTVDKIRTVKKLKRSGIYRNISRYKLVTIAYQSTRNTTTLSDEDKKNIPNVLCITVSKPNHCKRR